MKKNYNNDPEWEAIMELTIFENERMNEFDDAIENAKCKIKDAENTIERELRYGNWTDSEIIADAAKDAYDAITDIMVARNSFLEQMSDYTGCSFVIADAYSELYVETPHFYFDIEDMDVENTFYNWLSSNVRGSDDADELCETLFHYLAVA